MMLECCLKDWAARVMGNQLRRANKRCLDIGFGFDQNSVRHGYRCQAANLMSDPKSGECVGIKMTDVTVMNL
ncbi:hypothetical protein SxD43FB_08600 [Sphingobium sp. D43FB]|nr:hypothetical protein SxD43FB_08600 [Sphingobium sp. D43FB]